MKQHKHHSSAVLSKAKKGYQVLGFKHNAHPKNELIVKRLMTKKIKDNMQTRKQNYTKTKNYVDKALGP